MQRAPPSARTFASKQPLAQQLADKQPSSLPHQPVRASRRRALPEDAAAVRRHGVQPPLRRRQQHLPLQQQAARHARQRQRLPSAARQRRHQQRIERWRQAERMHPAPPDRRAVHRTRHGQAVRRLKRLRIEQMDKAALPARDGQRIAVKRHLSGIAAHAADDQRPAAARVEHHHAVRVAAHHKQMRPVPRQAQLAHARPAGIYRLRHQRPPVKPKDLTPASARAQQMLLRRAQRACALERRLPPDLSR